MKKVLILQPARLSKSLQSYLKPILGHRNGMLHNGHNNPINLIIILAKKYL